MKATALPAAGLMVSLALCSGQVLPAQDPPAPDSAPSETPRIVGKVADGTPVPVIPKVRRPGLRVLDTFVHDRGKRAIIIQKIVGAPDLPEPPPPAPPPDPDDPEVRARIAVLRANYVESIFVPISATVFDHALTRVSWYYPGGEGRRARYTAFSNLDFLEFSGFAEFEAGVDTWQRLFATDIPERPVFMVPAGTAGGNTHTLRFEPDEEKFFCTLRTDYPEGKSGTVVPDRVRTSPVEVTHTTDGPFAPGEKGFLAVQRIRGAKAVDLAVYPRGEDKTIAFHAVTLVNDDVEIEYPDPDDSGQTMVIARGCGRPGAICIRRTPGDPGGLYSLANLDPDTDDVVIYGPNGMPDRISTGRNGKCETLADPRDIKVIDFGNGEAYADFLGGGPNGAINTPLSSLEGISEDKSTANTGEHGIRQTGDIPARIEPRNIPTAAEIRDFLDEVYGKQANIWFQVTEVNHVDVAFDVGDPDGRFAASYPPDGPPEGEPGLLYPAQGNGEYDFVSTSDVFSTSEELLIRQAAHDSTAHLNFYFMPVDIRQIIVRKNEDPNGGPDVFEYLGSTNTLAGHGVRLKQTPIMEAKGMSKQALLFGIAHEIGHNKIYGNKALVHPRNPDTDLPDDPQTGSQRGFPLHTLREDQKRLMWGVIHAWGTVAERQAKIGAYYFANGPEPEMRINPKTNRPWAILIKQEWDVLQGVSDVFQSPPQPE